MSWTNQTIAITGAASGLGRSLSLHFAKLGADVLGLDRNEADLAALHAECGETFHALPCDVTDLAAVERAFAGQSVVHALINSAGITGKTNVQSQDTDPVDVERVFRVNYFGSYYTSKVLLPGMIRQGYGRVLHIASIAGKEGNAGMLAYSSSKAAVIGMAKVQGKELAGTGVTVNALAPAVIRTPLVEAMPEEQVKYMTSKIPMQRCATVEEVISIVEFSVSPACSFTTGFTFDLSGGRATY
jgi:NAD(P)-dependent dehydrogenase (short-subunit alcohol dehydrogenase family)